MSQRTDHSASKNSRRARAEVLDAVYRTTAHGRIKELDNTFPPKNAAAGPPLVFAHTGAARPGHWHCGCKLSRGGGNNQPSRLSNCSVSVTQVPPTGIISSFGPNYWWARFVSFIYVFPCAKCKYSVHASHLLGLSNGPYAPHEQHSKNGRIQFLWLFFFHY